RGSEVFPARRALPRDRKGNRQERKERAGAAARAFTTIPRRQDRRSDQPPDRASLRRANIWGFRKRRCRLLGQSRASTERGGKKSRGLSRADRIVRRRGRQTAGLGVVVVERSADLTITLVNDYLERRLAELNRQRMVDGTRWLLVQPSGVFPLVGPLFRPGESACWTCLFDRMVRNREIRGFLERG